MLRGLWNFKISMGLYAAYRPETCSRLCLKCVRSWKCGLSAAGARPDVTPLGMSRSMSGGRKAYIAHLGRPADRRTEMVDIFDPAEASEVGTTHQQRAYFQAWTASLRQSQ